MINGKFLYLGSDDITQREYSFKYDDRWLLNPSTEKNFDLLKFAYDLSLSASLKDNILDFYDKLGYSYTDKIDYAKEGMNVLAGDKIEDSIYYPAPEVDGKFYLNSIGYAIGYKNVGDSTLIIVSIRGGHYGSEWGGNFNIGTGQEVEGFKIAADQVLEGIKTVLKNNKFKDDIKILTSGYSRAAATSNLVAARLTQGEIEGIKPDNIFGFCFECPRNTRDPEAFSSKYDNIVTVSNPNDAIPRLAESVFGYRRYGKTYYLPGVENCSDFVQRFAKMKEVEKTVVSFQFMPVINLAYVENMFVNDFAFVIESLPNYVKEFQTPLMLAAAKFLGGAHAIELTDPEMFALGVIQQEIYDVNPFNAAVTAKYLGSEPKMIFKLNFNSPVFQNHAMELNLSWLESLDGYDDFCSQYYKLFYLNGCSKVTVYDSSFKAIASIDGQKVNNEANRVYLNFDNNGQIILLVNPEEDFSVELEGSNELMISYARFDMQLGLKDKIINYPMFKSKDTRLIIPKGEMEKPQIINDDTEIKANKTLEVGEFKNITVRIAPTIPDLITGGGYFTVGEIAAVSVNKKLAEVFEGWYVGDKCVSKDLTYRFMVQDDIIITAKINR